MKKLFLLFIIIATSCSKSSKLPDIGEECHLTQECLSAISVSHYDRMNEICNQKNEAALVSMIEAKTVYVLNPYLNTYTMRDKKFGKCKILVDNGEESFEVWVASEFIKPKE